MPAPAAPAGGVLRLGTREFGPDAAVVMAVVNRTPDSFYAAARSDSLAAALAAVERAVADGADVVDIGGVRAGPGPEVDVREELRRVVEVVEAARARHPELVISVDTWRADVAAACLAAGADVVNDAWGGHDPRTAEVAAAHGAALVCTHTGGHPPRTKPHRVGYDDVVADAVATTTALAGRAVAAGVAPERILVDPGHDFGKNTHHSLELTRRLDELVATGWPVLVALSRKDFVGETLDLPVAERLAGTLAATAVAAWLGARVFRVHDVRAARQAVDMVRSIAGRREPVAPVRGLA